MSDYGGYAFGASPFGSDHELCEDCGGTGHDPRDDDGLACMTCGGWGYTATDDGDDDGR